MLNKLDLKVDIAGHPKLQHTILLFTKLIQELNNRVLPEKIETTINSDINTLNLITDSAKELKTQIVKTQIKIISLVEKELNFVVKNHYQNKWLAIGIGVFGIPIGGLFALGLHNFAYLGIGLPIGMSIGMAVGAQMDKKAFKEGRQINFELEV